MNEEQLLNELFISFSLTTQAAKPNSQNIRLFHKLYSISFITKEERSEMGQPFFVYSISSEGKSFLENIPDNCKNKPYSYYLLLKERENIIQKAKEELNTQQIQSIVATNKSVSETNRFQKVFGIGSLIIGSLTMIFILVTTYQQCRDKSEQELQGIEIQLQKIDTTLKHMQPFLRVKDSARIRVKDSLRILL